MSAFITSIRYSPWSQGHFQPVHKLGTLQNPKLGQLYFAWFPSLYANQYARTGPSHQELFLSCHEPHKTYTRVVLFCMVPSTLSNMHKRVHPTTNFPSHIRNRTKPTLGQFYFTQFPLFFPTCQNGSFPPRMCPLCHESHETLNWGKLFPAISQSFPPLQQDGHCWNSLINLWNCGTIQMSVTQADSKPPSMGKIQ